MTSIRKEINLVCLQGCRKLWGKNITQESHLYTTVSIDFSTTTAAGVVSKERHFRANVQLSEFEHLQTLREKYKSEFSLFLRRKRYNFDLNDCSGRAYLETCSKEFNSRVAIVGLDIMANVMVHLKF